MSPIALNIPTLASSIGAQPSWMALRNEVTREENGTRPVRSSYGNDIMNGPKAVAYCSLTILVALYIVGAVSNGSLRHEVQTLPLWVPIVLGFRQQPAAKWAAVPCFIIWFTLMTFIWLFLLGWARILSGHFSPTEVVLTVIVGAASVTGLGVSFRWPTNLTWGKGLATAALLVVLQLAALRISFIPYIASH